MNDTEKIIEALSTPQIINLEADPDSGNMTYSCFNGINKDLEEILLFIECVFGQRSLENSDIEGPQLISLHVYNILNKILMQYQKGNSSSEKISCISIVFEAGYVDRFFRDTYYFHYSSKHFDADRKCLRLFIFAGDISQFNYYGNYSKSLIRKLNASFLGFLALSPVHGCSVTKSILNPQAFLDSTDDKNAAIRTCPYTCTMHGRRLYCPGFPYMQQDAETISCAEVTALLLTDYFSEMYQEHRSAMPKDILAAADRYISQRTTPSSGLSYEGLTHIMKDLGFYPLLIDECYNKIGIKYILHAYLDSNIPVAVHINYKAETGYVDHSIICVGFNARKEVEESTPIQIHKLNIANKDEFQLLYFIDSSDLCEDYYVMDDNQIPYCKLKFSETNKSFGNGLFAANHTRKAIAGFQYNNGLSGMTDAVTKESVIVDMLIPLSKRMSMGAREARVIFTQFLASAYGLTFYLKSISDECRSQIYGWLSIKNNSEIDLLGISEDKPLILRIFLTTSKSFKHKRPVALRGSKNDRNRTAAYVFATIPMPRFIWVCELYSKDSYSKQETLGEIILDATSTDQDSLSSIILCHYPGLLVSRMPFEQYNSGFWKKKFEQAVFLNDWNPYPSFTAGHTYYQSSNDSAQKTQATSGTNN